ncbi:MAG: ABC transporter substrate-binding protein [Propionibacteriaceae bacterium]|nr:ABC transporter substrate-binding protein [Propionibacteriaceae bacterium]
MKHLARPLIALVTAAALTLTGCSAGSGGGEASSTGSGFSQPIRIGALFAPTDTLDPATVTSPGGTATAFYLYDSLAMMAKDGATLSLAKSIEPNATADEWTVTLRDGLVYSDGTAATGQDVIDSLAHLAQAPSFAPLYSNVDFAASTAEGSTATLKLKQPASDFLDSSLAMLSTIAPKGSFTGVGAGPYVLEQGDPSTGYQLRANDKYWDGAPEIPQVTFVPIPDSGAQANALKTGEIDVASGLNSAALASLSGTENITIPEATLESAVAMELTLNTRVAPFDDPEVRRAAKLTLDRDKMVTTLLGSSGEVANDMLGMGYATYPADVAQTTADKAEAQRIFADKGITSFTIIAADTAPGLVASAELMVQEFAEVGVQVSVDKRDPQTFFTNMAELYQAPAFTMYWINRTPSNEFRSQIAPDSPYNVSGYASDTLASNFTALTTTLDQAEQQRLVGEISREVHDQGGDLVWGYQKQIQAHHMGLAGVTSFQSIPWLAKATFTPAS